MISTLSSVDASSITTISLGSTVWDMMDSMHSAIDPPWLKLGITTPMEFIANKNMLYKLIIIAECMYDRELYDDKLEANSSL
jgi:hypothetical protein